MEATHRAKICIIIAFLLSLLFHLSSVIYVAWQHNTQDHAQSSPQEQEEAVKKEIKQREEEWAETKARAGNFGAPVFFQDTSSFAEATADRPDDVQDATDDTPEPPTVEKEKPVEPEPTPVKQAAPPITIPPEKNTLPHKPIKKTVAPQPRINTPKKQPLALPKPPISLAQLTQGFLSHLKNEGTHSIHMLGKKNGTPSDEQIKHERYLQKINWCLQNSFNINRGRFPTSAKIENNVHILLSLNRDGSIKQCNVTKTSGNRGLDEFVVFNFKDASGSFPPVPQYLPYDPLTVTFIVITDPTDQSHFKMYRQ